MCGCGALFKGTAQLRHHQSTGEHPASKVSSEHPALQHLASTPSAATDASSLKCGFCPDRKAFKDAASLNQHMVEKHPTCPTCKQSFHGNTRVETSAHAQLLGHQKATGHCHCDQHNLAFRTVAGLAAHKRAEVHITGFGCMDCEREFGTQKGLDDHLKACPAQTKKIADHEECARATLAAAEEAQLRCESCDRNFKNLKAFKQHKASVKHKPLSNITCFLSNQCTQKFTSPSAWLFHVESGKCRSGMTRQKLYDIVHQHDTDRHITYVGNAPATSSIASSTSGGSVTGSHVTSLEPDFDRLSISSSDSGVILTPDGSDSSTVTAGVRGIVLTPDDSDAATEISRAGGVVLNPTVTASRSQASSSSGVFLTPSGSTQSDGEWSYVTSNRNLTPTTTSIDGSSVSTITYETARRIWPCGICNKEFKTKRRLLQHMNSPAHAPKLFHCPPAAVLCLSDGKPEKGFKTLSGFAQHIETGACNGGMDMLKKVVGIFEQRVKNVTGRDMRFLRGDS